MANSIIDNQQDTIDFTIGWLEWTSAKYELSYTNLWDIYMGKERIKPTDKQIINQVLKNREELNG